MAVTSDIPPVRLKRGNHRWDEWMDGRTWLLTAGVDFTASPASFKNSCYLRAPRDGHTGVTIHEGYTGDDGEWRDVKAHKAMLAARAPTGLEGEELSQWVASQLAGQPIVLKLRFYDRSEDE